MEETRPITKKETISYAIGGFGKNLAYGLVSTYTLYYYNAVLGISAAFVSVLLMAARIFDAFNDPLMGVIVAKTKSRYGKYRPWIFTGALTNAFVLFAMFSVPQSVQGDGLKVFVTITYFLCGITYTLSDIPYWSIIPAATKAGRIRENLTLYARTFSGIGAALPMIIGMALVVWLGSLGSSGSASGTEPNERLGFSLLALITAVIYIISTIITLKNLPPEQQSRMQGASSPSDPTVRDLLTSLIRNSHAMWIAAVIILFNTSIYMMTNLAVYLFQYDIGDYGQYTVFMSISGVTQFAAMVLLYPLLRKKAQQPVNLHLRLLRGYYRVCCAAPAYRHQSSHAVAYGPAGHRHFLRERDCLRAHHCFCCRRRRLRRTAERTQGRKCRFFSADAHGKNVLGLCRADRRHRTGFRFPQRNCGDSELSLDSGPAHTFHRSANGSHGSGRTDLCETQKLRLRCCKLV